MVTVSIVFSFNQKESIAKKEEQEERKIKKKIDLGQEIKLAFSLTCCNYMNYGNGRRPMISETYVLTWEERKILFRMFSYSKHFTCFMLSDDVSVYMVYM